MILGAIWSRKQSGSGYGSPMTIYQSREFNAIEASIRVLDFCGQRNAFARKYGSLIKDLWQHLDKGLLNAGGDREYTSSNASSANFMNLGQFQSSLLGSSRPFTDSGSIPESQAAQAAGPSPDYQSRASRSSLSSEDVRRGYDPSQGLLDARIKSWSEQFGVFYPTNDLSPHGTLLLAFSYECYTLTS
jgi:hypothetical protein